MLEICDLIFCFVYFLSSRTFECLNPGTQNGPARQAAFYKPQSLSYDPQDPEILYVGEQTMIRKIYHGTLPSDSVVFVFATIRRSEICCAFAGSSRWKILLWRYRGEETLSLWSEEVRFLQTSKGPEIGKDISCIFAQSCERNLQETGNILLLQLIFNSCQGKTLGVNSSIREESVAKKFAELCPQPSKSGQGCKEFLKSAS